MISVGDARSYYLKVEVVRCEGLDDKDPDLRITEEAPIPSCPFK